MLLTPSPCHKLSHILGPPPLLERDVLYGRPHMHVDEHACVYVWQMTLSMSKWKQNS